MAWGRSLSKLGFRMALLRRVPSACKALPAVTGAAAWSPRAAVFRSPSRWCRALSFRGPQAGQLHRRREGPCGALGTNAKLLRTWLDWLRLTPQWTVHFLYRVTVFIGCVAKASAKRSLGSANLTKIAGLDTGHGGRGMSSRHPPVAPLTRRRVGSTGQKRSSVYGSSLLMCRVDVGSHNGMLVLNPLAGTPYA